MSNFAKIGNGRSWAKLLLNPPPTIPHLSQPPVDQISPSGSGASNICFFEEYSENTTVYKDLDEHKAYKYTDRRI